MNQVEGGGNGMNPKGTPTQGCCNRRRNFIHDKCEVFLKHLMMLRKKESHLTFITLTNP
jgi:hypothetical protein